MNNKNKKLFYFMRGSIIIWIIVAIITTCCINISVTGRTGVPWALVLLLIINVGDFIRKVRKDRKGST